MYVSYYPYGQPATTLLPQQAPHHAFATAPAPAPAPSSIHAHHHAHAHHPQTATYIPSPAHLPQSLAPQDLLYPAVSSGVTSVHQAAAIPQHQALTSALPQHQALTTTIPGISPVVICRKVAYRSELKRGSEELMSHSPMIANGTGLGPQSPTELTDAKKAKLEGVPSTPSKVVHIRSVPPEAVETDIIRLGMPFGKMTNVLLLKQRNQAFLEFQDESSAENMVQYFENRVGTIGSKPVFIQYSNHKELKTDASHAFQNANAQAALQAANVVMGSDEQPTILRVIIDNALYPVSLEVLYQLFVKFGKVLKIITFTKNNTFQALIQMADAISSAAAKTSLDGQNIYNGCNTLRIEFSKLSQLNVKFNNDKSRDFTRDLPPGDLNLDALSLGGTQGVVLSPAPTYQQALPPGHIATVGQLPAQQMAAPSYGLPAMHYNHHHMNAMSALTGYAGYSLPPGALSTARVGLPLTTLGSAVLLVSNLDEEMVTPDALFTLFGVYGDVHRVKVLFNKKDNALIQMSDPHQAQLAITYLDKAKVWGKQIRVAQSKHQVVQMPKEGQSDAGLTKDFVNSPLHRFKRPGSKNCQNIFPPSQVLHLSNIPAHVTEEDLKTWFSSHGTVKAFKFFPPSVSDDRKDRKMALLQMNSTEEAIHALMAMHNYQMGESCHLRVSFSKSTI